jgi:hypothetical protein
MCNTLSQKTLRCESSQVKQSIFFYSITQVGTKVAAIFKGEVNQEQLIQDLNTEKEDNKIKKPQLMI